MTEPIIAHHPYGPSKLENYSPKAGGCLLFMPNPVGNEKAEFGSLKHVATSTRDLSILGGDKGAENEVSRVVEFMEGTKAEYPVVYSEVTLKTPEIFGTLDHLGLNEARTHGIIVDAKFGAWGVTPARRNLQGWAYVVLALNNFPTLKKIKVVFYMAKTGQHTEHTFWRYRLPALEKRIYGLIDRIRFSAKNPTEKDYSPNAVNCSFCIRVNCPARLAMMGTLATVWLGHPVELPQLNLQSLTTPQLAHLKKLNNVFKAYSAAVDTEAKRRAFDDGDVVEGYEIAEKSGTRTVVGTNNITIASSEILKAWKELGWDGTPWDDFIPDNIELSVADLEREIAKLAPKGKAPLAKKIIVDALEKAGLINATKIFYLSAIKE